MKILALSPHTDDAEIGAGASVSRWIEEGATVHVVALSIGNNETGSNRDEFRAAMMTLGVSQYRVEEFTARRFPSQRQEILQLLIDLRDAFHPDLVLCPATFDCHQDHQVVTAETVRAFRRCATILGYDMTWNTPGNVNLARFTKVAPRHLAAKIRAIECYQSQAHRQPMDERFIRSLARVRGIQCGVEFAEAFEVMRWIE